MFLAKLARNARRDREAVAAKKVAESDHASGSVIASEAKQSIAVREAWIASSQVLLAMTRSTALPSPRHRAHLQRRQHRLGNIRRTVAAAEFHRLDAVGIDVVDRALDPFAGFGGGLDTVLVG
jgi:hypothetical protein